MNKDIRLLESMLFDSIMKEIKERYEDVKEVYMNDFEIFGIAEKLKALSELIYEIFKQIPDPERNLKEDMYSTLYQILKDISSILYDLSIAEGEQINYVLTKAYKKIDSMGELFEKLT